MTGWSITGWKEVVQISVHRDSGHVLPDMILRSRKRCENEERHLVEADVFECFDVLRDRLRRVRREAKTIAVHNRTMPRF